MNLDLTITAQALTGTAGAVQALIQAAGTTPTSWLHFVIAAFVGVFSAPWGQNLVEGFVGKSPNFFVRLMAPTILGTVTSTVIAFAGKSWGITPQDAALSLATFLGAVHTFNATSFAADIKKFETMLMANGPILSSVAEGVLTAAGHPEAAALVGALSASHPAPPEIPADPMNPTNKT